MDLLEPVRAALARASARHRRDRPRRAVAPGVRRAHVAGRRAGGDVRRRSPSARRSARSAGFCGGLAGDGIMRLTDGMLTVPTFFLALLVVAVFGSSLENVVAGHRADRDGWSSPASSARRCCARCRRSSSPPRARSGRARRACSCATCCPRRMPSLIVAATLGVAYAVLTESALSAIWARRAAAHADVGQHADRRPALRLEEPDRSRSIPGAAIMLTVLSYNALGDALSDTLDPRHAGRLRRARRHAPASTVHRLGMPVRRHHRTRRLT